MLKKEHINQNGGQIIIDSMSESNSRVDKKVPGSFQKQKLYIEELVVEGDVDAYEKELKAFLSRFGTIIDIKILQNRALSRAAKTLRVCDLSRGRECGAATGDEHYIQR